MKEKFEDSKWVTRSCNSKTDSTMAKRTNNDLQNMKDEEYDLPSLYQISKLDKCPVKQLDIMGAPKCSNKPLSFYICQNRTPEVTCHQLF
jgi:hypothetical protein